jgi:hypothetical protein
MWSFIPRRWLAAPCIIGLHLCLSAALHAAEPPARLDPKHPFRTDSANADLPWYQLKPGEFPPYHSDHRVGGEVVEMDYIHRSGVFRANGSGELVNFTLPPFGTVWYLNAEADLRDVPLGTYFLFFLHQDENGAFTKAATMEDEYTMTANHGFDYRLDESKLGEGKLIVTKQSLLKNQPDAPNKELLVSDRTRVWKGDSRVKLSDLAVGDELLVNFTGNNPQHPRRCTDIWIGAETHKLVTEQQRQRHNAFLRERGVPAWVDSVDDKRVTVTLFSADRASLQGFFKDEGVDPALWAKEHRQISVAVANEHLRTYYARIVSKRATVQEFQRVPTECYGCSGVRWVIEPALMLEGFRKGRIVRLFANASWHIKDMPFGEGLQAGSHDEEPADSKELQPAEFPYRTDFGNDDLPWYALQPGKFPPDHSEHRVSGELVKVDAAHRSGQFRMDRADELVNFTLPPFGSVLYHNAEAELQDVPLGMRCLFFLYPDENGAFTKAGVIMDECSYLASNTLTYRFESAKLDEGKLFVARKVAPVKVDYILEPRQAPDFGRLELEVNDQTRVWKGEQRIKLGDIAVGDELLVNLAARTATSRGLCTDIWVGAETHRLAAEQQRKKHAAFVKEHGAPGWIDTVNGNEFTVTFFSGSRKDFPALLGPNPKGKNIAVTLADQFLNAQGANRERVSFKSQLLERDINGTYGRSGVSWMLSSEKLPDDFRQGRSVRVFNDGWPGAALPADQKAVSGK